MKKLTCIWRQTLKVLLSNGLNKYTIYFKRILISVSIISKHRKEIPNKQSNKTNCLLWPLAFKKTKFPLPIMDIDFYVNRLRNLEGIYSQLRDPRVKRMAHYLEDTRSVYLSCFKTMLTNVVAGKNTIPHIMWLNSSRIMKWPSNQLSLCMSVDRASQSYWSRRF